MTDTTTDRSDPPVPGSAPAAPPLSESPRRSFHLLLGTILLPWCAPPIVWGFALFWMRRATGPEARRWARAILALAVLDSAIVLATLLAFPVRGLLDATEDPRAVEGPAAVVERVMIGVVPDDEYPGPGARVESVLAGGPADRAGLRAGDVIVRLGDREIGGADALRAAAMAQSAGVPVALEWRRGGELLRGEATPELASRVSPPSTAAPEERGACFTGSPAATLVPLAAVLVILGVLAVVAGRRGSAAGVWWAALSLVGGTAGAYLTAGGACVLLGAGPTVAFVSLWGSSLGVVGVAALGLVRVRPNDAVGPPRPRMRWTSALALACWYALTGGLRLAAVLAVLVRLTALDLVPVDALSTMVQGAAHQAPSLLLLAFPIVLFAPIGEELAFRGLLQPALDRRWGPGAAIAVTSILFAALHWHYGLRLPLLLLLGAVLGWARFASGGLRAPILLHMLVNVLSFLALTR